MARPRINRINWEKDIKIIDENTIKYKGYTIYKDGRIKTPYDKAVSINPTNGYIRLSIAGRPQSIKGGRFIYEIFTQKMLSPSMTIVHKDGDITNIAYSNLIAISRKEYFKDHQWTYKYNKQQEEEIRNRYKNGGVSIKDLADEYECCTLTIQKIIAGTYSQPHKRRKS